MKQRNTGSVVGAVVILGLLAGDGRAAEPATGVADRVVDTGQVRCFGDRGQLFRPPRPGEPFFGQDACYQCPQPSYRDNGNGTVTYDPDALRNARRNSSLMVRVSGSWRDYRLNSDVLP